MNTSFYLDLIGACATEALGATLARILIEHQYFPALRGFEDNQISGLYLTGELGSGKTTFARGFVQALPCGYEPDIASPSFALCNMYDTTPPVLHCDVYRTAGALPEDLENALDDGYPFIIVEWAELIPIKFLPANRLDILFTGDDEKRHACLHPLGAAATRICEHYAKMKELTISSS